MKNKLKVLMIGPARNVKGGMTSVVDNYYEYGLDKKIDLKYIETVNDKNKISKSIKILKGYIEFSKNIKDYDIVHIHMASRMSAFRKAKYVKKAKRKNKKVIIHIHGASFKAFYEEECNSKTKQYIKKFLNLADKIIVLSEEWQEFFKELITDKNKIEIIYNAIVLPKDFNKNTETQKILFLGRFGKRKGIYDLLEVLEKATKEYPKIKLYAGGDGEIEKVKELIAEKKLQKNVKILGWVTGAKKEKLLKECSLYILPSYNEGMPMSVIEAMAYKNITISTNVGGLPRVINHNKNGLIINPGDKLSLYTNLKKILEDKNLREKLSNNARITTEEKFDINNTIKQLIEIYINI